MVSILTEELIAAAVDADCQQLLHNVLWHVATSGWQQTKQVKGYETTAGQRYKATGNSATVSLKLLIKSLFLRSSSYSHCIEAISIQLNRNTF